MSQLQGKFIANNAVSGTKFRLENNESIRGRNVSDTADITIIKLTNSDSIEFGKVPMVESSIGMPTLPKQLATVEVVDAKINNNLALVYTKRIDVVSDSLIYRGEAVPGSIESAAVWRISKMIMTGNDYVILWANGSSGLSNIWNDRLSLTYS